MTGVPASSRGLSTGGGTISGADDVIELTVKGAGTQTNNIVEVQRSNGNRLWTIDNDGAAQQTVRAGNAGLSVAFFADGRQIELGASASALLRVTNATGAVVFESQDGGGMATAPPASSASTLALGTAYQNVLGYDVLLTVYLSVTVNTSGVLKLGVGPTNTPTQQTIVTGITSTGLWPVPIYLPSSYYALLSTTGTITVAVDGQIAMPV